MRKRFSITLILSLVLGLSASVSFANGGLGRALRSSPPGVVQIAPNVFIDDRVKAEKALRDLEQARAQVARFFGPAQSDPRIILCTTAPCKTTYLGKGGPRGKTWAYHVVALGPKGVNRMIMAHELSHAELHRRMGLRDVLDHRFPSWFDEGLASYISRDDRLSAPTPERIARIKQVRTARQWGRVVTQLGWKQAYGAAMVLVEDVAQAGGDKALRHLITEVMTGADFDHVWVTLPGAR
ncbi:hypothetical protein [Aliiroseovarius subalbicans]|uniref:hypothetical protein n=1 Tax=Aliiroseovarius subalbicans TaxID=2925840 RepID=UPI001F5696CE|nr:hypothetical protein [Aliiroseovarius subalbicans]MCI2399372.1 hypothetical protein [Aliiroseovarius subalbicans]